jgi:adenylate cyclase
MKKEIEKKFEIDIDAVPDLQNFKQKCIVQYYLGITKLGTTKDEELRLRKVFNQKETHCYVTYKKGKGNIRDEQEFEISEELLHKLWNRDNSRPIAKTRYEIPYKDKIIELDIFNTPSGLAAAEIEFESEEEMNNFKYPEWFKKECKWSNKDIWEKLQNGHYDEPSYFSWN